MSGYPGQGYQGGYQGGYNQPPPNNGYGGYPPPQQQYGGYPQQAPPSPQPPYGYGTPPPQQYGGYQQSPPPQNYGYQAPPPQNNYGPPQGQYGGPPPNQGHPNVYQNAYNQGNHSAPAPPPQQAQAFGHGAPGNYTFQYSNCTGKRKALLIGINYFGQRGQLRGCINDVKNMSGYLNQHFGYKREDMVLLTDDQQNPMSQPTKANILRAMHWLVKEAQPNDSLFFHYSGHGGQTKDLDGDEEDGYDEVIYPVDFRTAGHIVDDEMHRIMVQNLKPGVRLTAIFDSCHSGSALDLPYIYSTQGLLKEPNLAKEAGQGLLGIVSSYARGDIGGMASSALGLFKKAVNGDDVYQKNLRTKTSPADVIMWSGSKDSQTSYVDPLLFPSSNFFSSPDGVSVVDFLPVSTVNMGMGNMGIFPTPTAAPLMAAAMPPIDIMGMPFIKPELDSAIGPSPLSPQSLMPKPWPAFGEDKLSARHTTS